MFYSRIGNFNSSIYKLLLLLISNILWILGACINGTGINSWHQAHDALRLTLVDVSNMVLVLLANEKYLGVTDPVNYMARETRPGCRLAALSLLAVCTNGIGLTGSILYNNDILTRFHWANLSLPQWISGISAAIRTMYLLISLCM
jgi:hypothetical protein